LDVHYKLLKPFLAASSSLDLHCTYHFHHILSVCIKNFEPKHHKWSLFDILSNLVPGVEFDGRIGESDNFTSLERCRFNHNLAAQKNARDKHLSAKQATQSSTAIIHDCSMAHINKVAPNLLGYQTYGTFYKTSMEDEVLKLEYSMLMTLYFAICKYLCPEIVFPLLPKTAAIWHHYIICSIGLHWFHFWYYSNTNMLQHQHLHFV
jgi:hypothetical protein